MKKVSLSIVFYLGLLIFAKAQANFEEFLSDFPLLSSNFTWTGEDLEKARTSGKKIQGGKLFFITDGQSALGEYFPIARIEASGTIFAFWAYHTGTYDDVNTQIHLCSRSYDKKGKPIGPSQNYMASSGGVKGRFSYEFEARFDSGKKTLLIHNKSSDGKDTKTLYSFTRKGYSYKNAD